MWETHASEKVVIWFPDKRNYEWRHGSAFAREPPEITDRDNAEVSEEVSGARNYD